MNTMSNPPRGNETRKALIAAAIDVFGHTGFDAASTRALAQAAGVNQALIGYHFGGKRGLYLAVFENIAEQMQAHMAGVVDGIHLQLDELPMDDSERRARALQLLLTLFDAFIEMLAGEAAAQWAPLVLREQQDPTEAFDLIYDSLMGRMLSLVTRLVATCSGMEEASEACRIRTLMILGHAMVFRIARGVTKRYMHWETLTPAHVPAIKEQFRRSIESQFSEQVPLS
jgi:AcrR family transcriptional regulator